ncbi:MAG: hypothetical protein ACI9FJ_000941 [Alteromonadaceae bacterium]|jgi:hypothetical protein
MNIKNLLPALAALVISGQTVANSQDITILDAKVDEKATQIQAATNNNIIPDAIEIKEIIRNNIISAEMSKTGATLDDMVAKYQLDESQARQLVIIVYSGGGAGIEPK